MQYVGQSKNFHRRECAWKCLKWNYANQLLTDDRNAYGLENFKVEILKECDDSELDVWEKHFIKELNTIYPNGYNDNEGGSIGFHHSDKTKKKIGDSGRGKHYDRVGINLTEEHKTNISKALRGRPPITAIKAHAEKSSMTVYQCKVDGTLVKVWNSIRDASRELHYQYNGIRSCCNGGFFSATKNKWVNCYTYKGYRWMYKEDYEKMLGNKS